jgi:hypothetical protein
MERTERKERSIALFTELFGKTTAIVMKEMREMFQVSEAEFAKALNMSEDTLRDTLTGEGQYRYTQMAEAYRLMERHVKRYFPQRMDEFLRLAQIIRPWFVFEYVENPEPVERLALTIQRELGGEKKRQRKPLEIVFDADGTRWCEERARRHVEQMIAWGERQGWSANFLYERILGVDKSTAHRWIHNPGKIIYGKFAGVPLRMALRLRDTDLDGYLAFKAETIALGPEPQGPTFTLEQVSQNIQYIINNKK